ncbi:DUF5327 family protein [Staphylococcus massiliensis]|uniref:YwdI family protein n=1 Tax=Staphylococcus massiliensis S46 TaxID=1229783 RepID=K9AJL6_9STAP|nr:DUF5327 family protein [Staphylococcus massiliensis]EKU47454.1 hypothetical protein C273_07767 [Staphylococcus massiliensis S46]
MIQKERIIEQIEHELVQAEATDSNQAFEKHMYTIHTLTELVVGQTASQQPVQNSNPKQSVTSSSQSTTSSSKDSISDQELKMMGGKVKQPSSDSTSMNNNMVTDDNIGNGDSIFDF